MSTIATVSPRAQRFAATIPAEKQPTLVRVSGTDRGSTWHGFAVEYIVAPGETGYALWRDAFTAVDSRRYTLAGTGLYLMDDGLSDDPTPFYVAGRAPTGEPHVLFLHRLASTARDPHPPAMCWHITVSTLEATD